MTLQMVQEMPEGQANCPELQQIDVLPSPRGAPAAAGCHASCHRTLTFQRGVHSVRVEPPSKWTEMEEAQSNQKRGSCQQAR
ncbi:hypothetical protein SKAU_G00236450 [Synaphobranchus kaupii]|uniref:Uncharacterized protein n=1 Tax=Synaphobranchus kaupii TaxID=118154 RepID=A0A9Q1F740_SYNKA|nr:hypothetical protein SKAU_G00236450 [Synaphobranchus kaupii]